MTYSVYQPWDPLKVCAVGRSYPPEYYSFISNSRVRTVMERIARETEEDYQKLITLLESFGVEVVRNNIPTWLNHGQKNKHVPPPMNPRDLTAMIGEIFYMPKQNNFIDKYNEIKGADWPTILNYNDVNRLPDWIKSELKEFNLINNDTFKDIELLVQSQGNKIVYDTGINTAELTRIGKDLYFGTHSYHQDQQALKDKANELFPDHRCHVINTGGHSDSTFCPVSPGLIVSLKDVPTYAETFPDWEVVYLPGQSWDAVRPFLELKEKNQGKWWVPGEELNDEFTDFVNTWLDHWVGYVEETVFDVNMLVIDEHNVICNNYNKQVFDAFDRYNITPHIVNLRHRYFWDGGLHCVTSDLHREGIQKDYFPERG